MNLSKSGLFELAKEQALSIVKIECEIKGYPRTSDYPVEILVETENFPVVFFVPRKFISYINFLDNKVPVAEIYAIQLECGNPDSKYVIKVMNLLKEIKLSAPFNPKKDKVHTFDILEELFGKKFRITLPLILFEN